MNRPSFTTSLGPSLIATAWLLVAALLGASCGAPRGGRVLEVEARVSPGNTAAQIFWATGYAFVEEQSSQVPVHPMADGFEVLRFRLPDFPGAPALRFDPLNAGGEMVIRRMRVVSAAGESITTINPASMLAVYQIDSFKHEGGLSRVVSTPGGHPMLFLRIDALERRATPYQLTSLTPLSLALSCLAVAILLASCVAVVVREAAAHLRAQPGPGRAVVHRALPWLWLTALLLFVFAFKLYLIRNVSAPVPFFDQWDGEASFFIDYTERWLSWRQMFSLHNEHRWFFSRLLTIGLVRLNGQWDPLLEQVVNALLHSGAAVVVASLVWVTAGCRRLGTIVLICAVVFAPPFSWENTLFGGASQFYLLLLFSAFAFWLVGTHRAGTAPSVLGWLCALCSLFTLAGGVLTSATLSLVALLRMLREPSGWRRELINVVAGVALVALGFAIASPPLAHHAPLRAATVQDFVTTLALGLAWPWSRSPLIGVSVWLPLLAVAAAALRRRVHLSATERFAAILAAWVLLQAAALAYGRGAHGPPPISRYMDLLSWTVLVNGIAFLGLVQRVSVDGLRRRGMQAALAVWIAVQTFGIVRVSQTELIHLNQRQPWFRAHVQNVAQFMVTGDTAWFRTLRAPDQQPYPDAAILANGWLRHPYVRGIMPSDVREPLRISPSPGVAAVFVRDGVPGGVPVETLRVAWGSFTAEGAAGRGRFESRPLASCVMRKRLRIEVAGDAPGGGMRLALKSLSGEEFPVPLDDPLTNRWHPVTVPCPPGPFSIVADDASGDGWLAFREPVEIGSVSARIETLIRHSRIVQNLAAGLMLISAALSVWLYAGRHRGRLLPGGGLPPVDTAPSGPEAGTITAA